MIKFNNIKKSKEGIYMDNKNVNDLKNIFIENLKDSTGYNESSIMNVSSNILKQLDDEIRNEYDKRDNVEEDYKVFLKKNIKDKETVYANIFITFQNINKFHSDSLKNVEKKRKNHNVDKYRITNLKSYEQFKKEIQQSVSKVNEIYITGPFKCGKTAFIYEYIISHSNDYYICLYDCLADNIDQIQIIDKDVFFRYSDKPLLIIFDTVDEPDKKIFTHFENITNVCFIREKREDLSDDTPTIQIKLLNDEDLQNVRQQSSTAVLPKEYNYFYYVLLDFENEKITFSTILATLLKKLDNSYIVTEKDLKYFIDLSFEKESDYPNILYIAFKNYFKNNEDRIYNTGVVSKIEESLKKKLQSIYQGNVSELKNLIVCIWYILLYIVIKRLSDGDMSALERHLKKISKNINNFDINDINKDKKIALLMSYHLVNHADTLNSIDKFNEYDYLKDVDDINVKRNFYDALSIFLQSLILNRDGQDDIYTVAQEYLNNIENDNELGVQAIKLLMILYQGNSDKKNVLKERILKKLTHFEKENTYTHLEEKINICFSESNQKQ